MPLRILFVEDNVNTSKAMKVMLELKGYAVDTAATVAQAAALLSQTEYQLLISDIGLPDGSGYDLIGKKPSQIPAIALSGYATEADRQESLGKGFDWHLGKPFKLDELLGAIHAVTSAVR